jgi:hypothetical protein
VRTERYDYLIGAEEDRDIKRKKRIEICLGLSA